MKRSLQFQCDAKTTLAPLRAAGEFTIDDSRYMIVLEDSPEATGPALGHFEVDGKRCAIVAASAAGERPRTYPAELLTERELQIATLVALGRPNKQIADRLHISAWTVSTHLRRIFAKLGVESRAAMVYLCASLIERDQQLLS
jgi:DNA-binding CsgD family transcriptional regulator